ncbi:MAG: hypothetical protein M5U11_01100 [Anaerolineales bacterium]|jgi:hypothetical protein|nr:hypothetical protein [Anaerolineales bacterium]MDX9938316.1 hypothetical protein [Anaerolineales bacterium]WKZ53669.1 MAG: hypothetical protein QY324_12640 [Anaerolineales bacterium]GER79022.1 conserved hypothetical protein [Candidatus Denitrolinea symbiosum]
MFRRNQPPSSAETFTDLESRLAGTLKRVAPPRGFVQRLRDRVHIPEPRVIAERIASWKFFFAVVGGVMSGMVLILTVARALFHLFGRRQFQ